MELWIRSQDGHKILKANEIYVCKHDNNHVYANTSIECCIELGNYATKQRALEVLDEIQSKFKPKVIIKNLYTMNDENFKKAKEGLNGIQAIDKKTNLEFISNDVIVYEMPQE